MLYLPNDKMFVNRFVYCEVPSKREIFSRTGQVSVSPNGVFTGDEAPVISKTPTMSAQEFLNSAESFEKPKDE